MYIFAFGNRLHMQHAVCCHEQISETGSQYSTFRPRIRRLSLIWRNHENNKKLTLIKPL